VHATSQQGTVVNIRTLQSINAADSTVCYNQNPLTTVQSTLNDLCPFIQRQNNL
jgi:hypothetical protein